jgi:hypothetical protein
MFTKELAADQKRRYNVTPHYQKQNYLSSQRYSGSGLMYGDIFGRDDIGYDAFDNDIAKVQIYFRTATVFKMHRAPVMTGTDFWSNIGGIFGLILGMSIITVFEIIWLFCF